MKAMIFAAGLGTRLQPLTNDRPKALVELGGMTLLERCIKRLISFNITDIVINVHHFADLMEDYLLAHDNFGANIQVSDEREMLMNTGGAIRHAKSLLAGNEPILIVNVDILSDLNFTNLLEYHTKANNLATLVVRQRETSRYLLFNEDFLCGWKNIKTGETKTSRPNLIDNASPFAFSGIQIISPEFLNLITETGAFSSIDMYLRLAQQEKIGAFIDANSIWMDLGKYSDIHTANKLLELK
ncbi:MAG: NDP-sugar synthase [Mangrovibacterium sp.]